MNLRRFSLVYLATMLGLMMIVVLVQAVGNFNVANAGMAIIPAMVAGLVEGQRFAGVEKRLPESSQIWRFACRAAVIILGLTMISVSIFSVAAPQIKLMLSHTQGALLLLAAILFQTAVSFLLVRYFVALGAKSALRAQADLAAKTRKGGRG
ncbi:ABZJ_00895 family protein [Tritonibacter horizontis]|uniref:Uncharacterized protein n=1 Tax=Tritonibacter horizontis TaxID=1768241 RepID=A0A132C0M7_9RHOB|nr:ABZJ_00895 family protein [Tritonibacter horizontis]KUP94138.1 hypothetical protein TRIHO_09930 [Tritonibacter horizontis]